MHGQRCCTSRALPCSARRLRSGHLLHCAALHADVAIRPQVIGPGGQNVVTGPDGGDWLTYHSADPGTTFLDRKLSIAPITWTAIGPEATVSWRVPEVSQ